jgi:hypothetical protein
MELLSGKRHSLEFGESFKHITYLRSRGDDEVTRFPPKTLLRYPANLAGAL